MRVVDIVTAVQQKSRAGLLRTTLPADPTALVHNCLTEYMDRRSNLSIDNRRFRNEGQGEQATSAMNPDYQPLGTSLSHPFPC